ncbi:hypothetical protein D9M71_647390 [compost metagenome]
MLRNHRVIDRAVGQPLDQLALSRIQRQAAGVVEQASTGIGMITQGLAKPLIAGHVQDQASTAIGAAAGMVKTGGNHHEALLDHLTATPVDLEIQRTRQPEHQLRVLMAVDDQVMGVLAQGKDRSHRGSFYRRSLQGWRIRSQSTPSAAARAVTGLTRRCHGPLTRPGQACQNLS